MEIEIIPPTTGLSVIQEIVLIVGAVVATLIAIFALDIWAMNFLLSWTTTIELEFRNVEGVAKSIDSSNNLQ